jgi:rubrerythrin
MKKTKPSKEDKIIEIGRFKNLQGEWIATSCHPYVDVIIKCSICDYQEIYKHHSPENCPACGIKMANARTYPKGWAGVLGLF